MKNIDHQVQTLCKKKTHDIVTDLMTDLSSN